MNYARYAAKIAGFKLFRAFRWPKMMPSNVVYSVTNLCNSRCETCFIWEKYAKNKDAAGRELTTAEWLRTFESIGPVTFCVWTGGEPFLRKDALELLQGVYDYNRPDILVICHNGSMPGRFREILDAFLSRPVGTDVTVNLSLDAIGEEHDRIRGLPGNWTKLVESIQVIKDLQKKYRNLNLGIHTVVSKWNVDKVPAIYDYVVKNFNPDSYKMEPAELRYELGTVGSDILPAREKLAGVLGSYSTGRNATKLIELVRKIYIDRYIKRVGNPVPCYATFNHVQITAGGNVWICCMMADHEPMGDLHDVDFDFRRIWFSRRADDIRKKVKARSFAPCRDCYLAVAANTSIPQNVLLVARYLLRQLFRKGGKAP